ncbi:MULTISPECIES: carbohydrate ABC transporter permease [Actinomadura]|uniref:carbohydrate ABC transporter permease n=1 Tax=Actinomadura TaxID=1988 RepID=UPI0003ACF51C|nr:carbohydrate ABC transporter permease [Actinomadura madurae]MCP9948418.1 carbohydrate ABC transporter permease [Actinomadura madurae]MCP9965197.1 carbohydrate ABC transporter permease [Actinomadura madurae]MCP9977681.1 carbohydrate ABC transporter permease [Actinomadura madurae]MCQ0010823.1 carbohydrate ABC transporter permease [Actinomadura madurae]MCQ0013870.1 carbohydrate ABC transporter permease [Actinomadura madurae]
MSGANRRWLLHVVLVPVAVLFAAPLVWMVLTSLMPDADLNRLPPRLLPDHVTLDGYRTVLTENDYPRWFLNTLVVSTVAVLSHVVLCSLAGYGFARLRFAGGRLGFLAVMVTIMIPVQLLMIPTFLIFRTLGLIDTLGAAFVPWLASAFGIFLMRQFFLSVPPELEEAARIDGCGRLGVFFRIVLPMARPALATLVVFTLLGSWNDLIWPLIAITSEDTFTLQMGLSTFSGTRHTEWSSLMAGNTLATAPLLVAFLVAQRHFIATMSFSGLKG